MPSLWPHTLLGKDSDPAVLFLHGFLGRGQDWLPIARILAGDFFCILPDLPGHGAHPSTDSGPPLSFNRVSADLSELIDHLQVPAPVLVGYSLGGRAALHFTCTNAGRVRGLVLESASPGIPMEADRSARAALDDHRAAELESGGLEAFLDKWYRADLWKSLRKRPEVLEQLKSTRASGDAAGLARTLSGLSPGRMPNLWPCLPGLRTPVIMLAGALDRQYAEATHRAAGYLPDGRMRIIEDAGHNTHLEQPEAFTRVLQDFLAGLR